jgi:hypothetical protein
MTIPTRVLVRRGCGAPGGLDSPQQFFEIGLDDRRLDIRPFPHEGLDNSVSMTLVGDSSQHPDGECAQSGVSEPAGDRPDSLRPMTGNCIAVFDPVCRPSQPCHLEEIGQTDGIIAHRSLLSRAGGTVPT